LAQQRHRARPLHHCVGQRGQEADADGTKHRARRRTRHRRQRGRDGGEIGRLGRVGGAEGADGVGIGEHAVRTATVTVRFH
jgi:hypothetical protein